MGVIFKFKRKMLRLIIACIFYQSVVVDSKGDVAKSLVSKAKPKQFSLFTVVTFPNNQCTSKSGSTTGATYGTCLSNTECSTKGGTVDGNCASGFGVCCVFKKTTCGSSVAENCTYIQNPGFSTTYTTSGSCSYSVTPLNTDICQMRLDFDKFATTFTTSGATSGNCVDTFTITSPSSTNALPELCGTLTGQHIYFENGRSSSTSTLAFTISTSTTGATWNIKVTQIECSSTSRAPTDCAQYITGASGYITSYNWQKKEQISGNLYTYCVRREKGYCTIMYQVATGETIDTFQLDDIATSINTAITGIEATVLIEGSNGISGTYSGDILSSGTAATADAPILSWGPQFHISHRVLTTSNCPGCTGFKFNYAQLPCTSYHAETNYIL